MLLLNTNMMLFFLCKELHDKEMQTLKMSHSEQAKAAESVVEKLVTFDVFVKLHCMLVRWCLPVSLVQCD